MTTYLLEARVGIDTLLSKLSDANLDTSDALALAVNYQKILTDISLSWHVAFMETDDWKRLSAADSQKLGNKIPNFGFEVVLTNDIAPNSNK